MACGDSFTLVLSEKYEVFAFGKTSHGRLGVEGGNEVDSIRIAQKVSGLEGQKIVHIDAGCRHAGCVSE